MMVLVLMVVVVLVVMKMMMMMKMLVVMKMVMMMVLVAMILLLGLVWVVMVVVVVLMMMVLPVLLWVVVMMAVAAAAMTTANPCPSAPLSPSQRRGGAAQVVLGARGQPLRLHRLHLGAARGQQREAPVGGGAPRLGLGDHRGAAVQERLPGAQGARRLGRQEK